jgi:hypothetical protein
VPNKASPRRAYSASVLSRGLGSGLEPVPVHFRQELRRDRKTSLISDDAVNTTFRTQSRLALTTRVWVNPVLYLAGRINRQAVKAPADGARQDFLPVSTRVGVRIPNGCGESRHDLFVIVLPAHFHLPKSTSVCLTLSVSGSPLYSGELAPFLCPLHAIVMRALLNVSIPNDIFEPKYGRLAVPPVDLVQSSSVFHGVPVIFEGQEVFFNLALTTKGSTK